MSTTVSTSAIPADWAHSLASAEAFRQEQRCLGQAWTFLGLTFELAKDGDWFRARIGERSVFVQRFGSALRGFENRCAHRFYPLRMADRGNGPIICGFHGWRYDKDGAAVGIPQCREMFGTIPGELGARLAGVEIALCGTLIFGRFDASGGTDTLEEFLAEGFPILEAMSRAAGRTAKRSELVKANWKLCIHASLDDYHLVSVHPTTLGRGGPIPVQNVNYHRFGNNIAYFNTSKRTPFADMVSDLREKAFRPTDFSIFHLCPGTFLTLFHAYGPYWYCAIVHYEAVAHDRSRMRIWIYPAPFPVARSGPVALFRALSEYVRTPIISYVLKRVFREDHAVCEGLQTNAGAIDRAPRQAALELRIGWFEQAYRKLMAQGQALLDAAEHRRPS